MNRTQEDVQIILGMNFPIDFIILDCCSSFPAISNTRASICFNWPGGQIFHNPQTAVFY